MTYRDGTGRHLSVLLTADDWVPSTGIHVLYTGSALAVCRFLRWGRTSVKTDEPRRSHGQLLALHRAWDGFKWYNSRVRAP